MSDDMRTLGSKPIGWKGVLAGKIMDLLHARFYKKIIKKHIINTAALAEIKTVLDLGCGGGASVKIFSGISEVKKVCGIDYSDDMVRLSKRVNKKKISTGTVEIIHADVSKIPFEDNSFDLVCAFDSINFWPDHKQAMSEIKRVLKNSGRFFIVNAYPKEGTKWHYFVKFKNDIEYRDFLLQNGLRNIEAMILKKTIIVKGGK